MTKLVGYLIVAIAIAFSAYRLISRIRDEKLLKKVTDRSRGTWGERHVIVDLLKHEIPEDNIYHDLYVEYQPGFYAQIDLVVVIPAGVVVVEHKDYSGWIFGKGWQEHWMQVLNYGKEKNQFYNPVKQNESHIRHLKKVLGMESEKMEFISVVAFGRYSTLKNISDIPENVYVIYDDGIPGIIKKAMEMPARDFDSVGVKVELRKSQKNGQDPEIREKQLELAKEMSRYYRDR